jgi:hypothetical protein
MNHPWTTWLLAGALAASLAWNLRDGAPPPPEPSEGCAVALDPSELGLSPEQAREIESWKANACSASCSVDATVTTKLDELHAALRDPSTPPEKLHELAAQASQLRADSLDACIDSIVAVRRVLTREQLGKLLDRCCAGGVCQK